MSASRHKRRRPSTHAFTLVEAMISMTLIGLLTAAVLSSFVFTLRGEQSLANYNTMNGDARELLERFSRDAKCALDVTNATTTSVTMMVPYDTDLTHATAITYEYNSGDGTVTRETGGVETVLATGVSNTFAFTYLNILNVATTSLPEIKQIQLSLRMVRTVTSATTSQYVISAQYTLRSKPVAH
jgi:type II secretory pathway pseudopilin PulG